MVACIFAPCLLCPLVFDGSWETYQVYFRACGMWFFVNDLFHSGFRACVRFEARAGYTIVSGPTLTRSLARSVGGSLRVFL